MLRLTRGLTAAEAVKFGITVGFAAIFVDAAIAHGLFWENDPYWTYWITKTFLITTVFTVGTALFGLGLVQGLALTAVHTLILEIYYQFFAPIVLDAFITQALLLGRLAGLTFHPQHLLISVVFLSFWTAFVG